MLPLPVDCRNGKKGKNRGNSFPIILFLYEKPEKTGIGQEEALAYIILADGQK